MTARTHRSFGITRRDVLLLVVIGLVQGACVVASVLLIRIAINRFQTPAVQPSDLLSIAALFTAVAMVLAIARGAEFTYAEQAGYDAVGRIRVDLHHHLTDLPTRAVARSSQGALILRFTGDLSTLRTWLSRGLARGIVNAIIVVGGVGVLVFTNALAALAVVGVLLVGTAVSLAASDRVRRATRAVRWRRSLLASNIIEQVRSLAVVQVFGRTAGERARLEAQSDDLVWADNRMVMTRGRLRGISSATGSLAVSAVLVVGAFAIPRGQATVADIVAAITAVRFLSGPIRILGRVNEYWPAAQVSRRKLHDFFNRATMPVESDDLVPLRPRAGRIEFRDVSVAGVLDDVNLTVQGGEILAITGANGAGKSTLLALLARFLEPDSGEIVIDDQLLTSCTRRSTYRAVGMVSPDLPLMRGTVKRNLSYRYRSATDEQLEHVIMTCRIDELVEDLPGGLSAWLTEGGGNLSTGQRQRLALGRAILGSPRILLLDEPTSNLDARSAELFRRIVAHYRGTILLVTHDPAELAIADHVCVMVDGRVEEYLSSEEYRARTRPSRYAPVGGRSS
ncbi:MAG: ABC transporter ATP-binding protein [Acidimicrobiia bacterium]|nr:ABC transporter ATP-binding protein [Acidimicrobiia bacterium]